jgi:hypothetical protein
MAKALEQIHQPPPGAGGLDGDRRLRRKLREELLHVGHIVHESMLGEFAVLREDRDLRRSFVQVNPYVRHRIGLLAQGSLHPALSNQPISGWAGGQRAYHIKNFIYLSRLQRAFVPNRSINNVECQAAFMTISAKLRLSSDAPPTSAPSTSGCFINSRTLEGLTLPPY